jgi:hypothetical protein|tara:strand:- start:81 stop:218 length:138 start_codon:yes stop_codon:yes gene_type:complete
MELIPAPASNTLPHEETDDDVDDVDDDEAAEEEVFVFDDGVFIIF